MKLWQFLKRWRQAYLDDKGDRLHAEAEQEAHFNCSANLDRTLRNNEQQTWLQAFAKAHDECSRYEEEEEYYRS